MACKWQQESMLGSCCQSNCDSHRLLRQVMWSAALTSLWEAVWCSELSCKWVLWSVSLKLLVASKLVPDTCGCKSTPRQPNASFLLSSPGYGHLKSDGTTTQQPPEVSSLFFFFCSLLFLQVKSQCHYMLAITDALKRMWDWKEISLWGLGDCKQTVAWKWTGCNNLNPF